MLTYFIHLLYNPISWEKRFYKKDFYALSGIDPDRETVLSELYHAFIIIAKRLSYGVF